MTGITVSLILVVAPIHFLISVVELIRWKIVTHAFIDGYSRLVVGIHAVGNNRPDTVLALFKASILQWGRPSRVRGDYGIENQAVAEDQENANGRGRGSYIFGR
jgi:hypothetical protein